MRAFPQNKFVKWVLAPVAVLWALGWGYFQFEYPTCTFRYRLTAEVMTPDGLKTGSSVVEVSYGSSPILLPDGPHHYGTLKGEATYIDLGGGKNLFVTLGTLYSNRVGKSTSRVLWNGRIIDDPGDYLKLKGALDPLWLPIKIFRLGREYRQEREMCRRASKFYGSQAKPIDLNNLPTLMSFADLNQPETVVVVNPYDLANQFGTGYSLATKIEILNAPLTDTIDTLLPWVKRQETGQDKRPLNRSAAWEFYKFRIPAESSYLLHDGLIF